MNSGELKVDVPLASVESDMDEEDESTATPTPSANQRPSAHHLTNKNLAVGGAGSKSRSSSANRNRASPRFNLDGGDSVTGSLEDLVNSFDQKLTKVFHDYQEQVDKIAPVQVRSQEEIMNECQVWWTITGNFGNMLPIDWSKSTARAKHLPTLNLGNQGQGQGGGRSAAAMAAAAQAAANDADLEEEDDIVAADLDMHSLILSSNPQENAEPLKSADEVIKEIDDLIDESEKDDADDYADGSSGVGGDHAHPHSGHAPSSSSGGHVPFTSYQRSSRLVSQALAGRKLEELTTNELTQILSDVEILVRELSEELVNDLGVRDELEYEKELKNTFISLLLSIQSKRRQHAADGGGPRARRVATAEGGAARGGDLTYKYLTTVIPYQPDRGAPPLHSLQALVKILKAINEDSPAVPALLTDYILKVLCPS